MKLTDRRPHLDATTLVDRFVPPPRFDTASFGTYIVDPLHPSQQVALETMRSFATVETESQRQSFFRRNRDVARTRGLYLDGGYGVGKTHLLAALWNASSGTKAYLTFTELTAFIGFASMTKAVKAFRQFDLICIDEFELDDVANTLMVVTLLRSLADAGAIRLAVTSNTLPDRLGEQRFSAQDFRREIAAIASYFDELRIEGSDFRQHTPSTSPSFTSGVADRDALQTTDDFNELLAYLRTLHPVQYGALLDDVSEVTIRNLRPIDNQDAALLFVQLVDKIYDARIRVNLDGCDIDDLFLPDYRGGGYRKKYGRAESRLMALRNEATATD